MVTREVVIARYREPLEWVAALPGTLDVTIYNKNPAIVDPGVDTFRAVYGNVRTEYTTGGLSSLNVVDIPNPPTGREAHTFLYHLVYCYGCLADFTWFLQGNPFDHAPSLHKLDDTPDVPFVWVSPVVITSDRFGNPHHPGLPVADAYHALMGNEPPDAFQFSPGAQFGVSRELVYNKPQSFYQRAAEILETRFNDTYAWTMERLWYYLFMD